MPLAPLLWVSLISLGTDPAEEPVQLREAGRAPEGEPRASDRQEQLASVLEMALADIDRACRLDERQIAKLRIAIKGAVEDYVRETVARDGSFDGFLIQHEPIRPAQPPPDELNPEREVLRRYPGVRAWEVPSVTEQAIWIETVNGVLTAEQRETYARVQEERRRHYREAIQKHLVAAVDRALLLSAEQRDQISLVLGERLAGDRLAQVDLADRFVSRFSRGDTSLLLIAIFLVPDASAREIFTEPQWKRWTDIRKSDRALTFGWDFSQGSLEILEEGDEILIVRSEEGRSEQEDR